MASSRRVSTLISEILNVHPHHRRRDARRRDAFSFSSLVSFYIFLSRMIVRQNARVYSRACAYVFGYGQSRRSIVRRCIILLGAKGDDFITDPGNHSPKLTLFSVKAVLFLPPRILAVQFYPCRFHGKRKRDALT